LCVLVGRSETSNEASVVDEKNLSLLCNVQILSMERLKPRSLVFSTFVPDSRQR